jgi:hypothetical protein
MDTCNKRYSSSMPSTSFSLIYEKKKTCNLYKFNTPISQQNYILNRKKYFTKRNQNKNEKFDDIFINPNCEYKEYSRLNKTICK